MKVIKCKRQRSHIKTLLFQRRASRKFHVSQNPLDKINMTREFSFAHPAFEARSESFRSSPCYSESHTYLLVLQSCITTMPGRTRNLSLLGRRICTCRHCVRWINVHKTRLKLLLWGTRCHPFRRASLGHHMLTW